MTQEMTLFWIMYVCSGFGILFFTFVDFMMGNFKSKDQLHRYLLAAFVPIIVIPYFLWLLLKKMVIIYKKLPTED